MKWLLGFFIQLWLLLQNAESGNYIKCSKNYCQNGGQCLVMTPSPVPIFSTSNFDSRLNFTIKSLNSDRSQSWTEANNFCQDIGGDLFTPLSPASVEQAQSFFLTQFQNATNETIGLWTGICDGDQCKVMTMDQNNLFIDVAMTDEIKYPGLCSVSTSKSEKNNYIYTCQCSEDFGFENCTATDSASASALPGVTYCQSEKKDVVIDTFSPTSIIYVDHVAFGRPFYKENSIPEQDFCPPNIYAKTEDEYCVAKNALAAVIYWCQGKHVCRFSTELLTSVPPLNRDFYVPKLGAKMTFTEAVATCQKEGHSLAVLSSTEDAKRLRDIVHQTLNLVDDGKPAAFWIDSESQKYFEEMAQVYPNKKLDSANGCVVLQLPKNANNSDIYIHWKACFSPGRKYSVICQTGQTSRMNAADSDCIKDLKDAVFEYRYHVDENLSKIKITCPTQVLYRKGSTCYKKTEPMSWRQARDQCWRWGGDLSFPLPKTSKDCSLPTFLYKTEEQWIAGSNGCDEERCPIPFDSPLFEEGTFDIQNDLCFPKVTVDEGCKNGKCDKMRVGLCAIAPARQPRTSLPSSDSCPPSDSSTAGWPYPDYSWDEPGIAGEIAKQSCPEGQSGEATWFCSKNAEWIGVPDLTNCVSQNLDVDSTLDDLANETSVPSEVIQKFYDEVKNENNLGAGDIKKIINVLDEALKVQKLRIVNSPDPEQYADSFTRESLNLFDNILLRQESWLGIPNDQKRSEVTKIQQNIEDAAMSLIKYSNQEEHDYNKNKNIAIKVIRNVMITSSLDFYSSGSGIQVNSSSQEKKSLGFFSFNNLACVLQDIYKCEIADDDEPREDNFLNSAVLGATIYNPDGDLKDSDEVTVILKFKHLLNGKNYNVSGSNCSFWDVQLNDWSTEGCNLIETDEEFTTCQCDHLTNFGILMDINGNLEDNPELLEILTWITMIGCSLSIISLMICVYIFTAIRGLKGDRTTIHRNLCICLLLAEILLITGLDATENYQICSTVAGFLHFFFLASFSWMLVEGIHVYYMLVKVFDTGRSLLWLFYAVGYGLPSAIVILSVVIVEASGTHGYGTERYCWLSTDNGLIWAFAGPVIVVILVNTAMFLTALNIARKSIQKRQVSDTGSKTMTLFKGSFSLLCILGLTWIFGFTYFANGAEWMAVVFAILNSFQGVFILVFHVVLNEKAKQEVSRHSKSHYRYMKSFMWRKTDEPSASTFESSSATTWRGKSGKDRSKGSASTSDPSRKISVETTMTSVGNSAGNKNDGDQVKYYRGHITMSVVGAGQTQTQIPEEEESTETIRMRQVKTEDTSPSQNPGTD